MSDHEPRVRTEYDPADSAVTVRVRDTDGDRVIDLEVERGAVLHDALFDAGILPYVRLTKRVDCDGRSLCATYGVRVRLGEPTPDHQHDDFAARFGHPRLSCQFRVDGPLTVELVEKVVRDGRG